MNAIPPRPPGSVSERRVALLADHRGSVGLASVPETWIHAGGCDVFVTSPWGGDRGTLSRTATSVDIDLASALSPDLEIQATSAEQVKIVVKTPWPLPDIKAEGPMRYDETSDTVYFRDERSPRTAEMWQTFDGRVHVVVHEPQQDDVHIVLTTHDATKA